MCKIWCQTEVWFSSYYIYTVYTVLNRRVELYTDKVSPSVLKSYRDRFIIFLSFLHEVSFYLPKKSDEAGFLTKNHGVEILGKKGSKRGQNGVFRDFLKKLSLVFLVLLHVNRGH